jgi:Mg-chelatase subunit ChlD
MKEVNALSLYELNKYARAVAQEAGLSVATSTKGHSYLDGKTIYIAPEPVPINQERAIYQLRKIIHEVAHFTDSDMELWNKVPLKQDSPLRNLWNMVEDHRIEYVQSQRYEGDADLLDAGTAVAAKGALKKLAEVSKKAKPEQRAELDPFTASLAFDIGLRGEWQPSLNDAEFDLTPEQEKLRAKLAPFAEEIRKVRTIPGKEGTAATYEVAKKLLTAMGGDVAKEEAEGKAAGAKAAGHGTKIGEGEGNEVAKAKAMATLSPQEAGTNEYFDHNFDGGGKGRYGAGVATACDPAHFYVKNYANPHKSHTGGRTTDEVDPFIREHSKHYERMIADARAHGSSSEQLAQKMRRLVQVKTRSRVQYALKSGKLHGSSLHRIAVNVPGYSERVFKQKTESLDIDAAVGVCVDMSGSMGGNKMTHAAAAAEMLNETVGNALGVPLMIYGFSETRPINGSLEPSPSIYVLRDFNEKQVPTTRFRERTCDAILHTMGNNPDGDAVIWGYHQLRHAKGKRKILFVLSDGSPASARKGNQNDYLTQVTALIEKSPIKLFGLGLQDTSVQYFYKKNAVVTTAEDIEPKIISLVDNFILEGK